MVYSHMWSIILSQSRRKPPENDGRKNNNEVSQLADARHGRALRRNGYGQAQPRIEYRRSYIAGAEPVPWPHRRRKPDLAACAGMPGVGHLPLPIRGRQRENEAFLGLTRNFLGTFRGMRDRFAQRKEYRFFRCPSCRTWLRVPRGRGKLNITCRQCGERFTRST